MFTIAMMLVNARGAESHFELIESGVLHGLHLEVEHVVLAFRPGSDRLRVVARWLTRVIVECVVDVEEAVVERLGFGLQRLLLGILAYFVERTDRALAKDAIPKNGQRLAGEHRKALAQFWLLANARVCLVPGILNFE